MDAVQGFRHGWAPVNPNVIIDLLIMQEFFERMAAAPGLMDGTAVFAA
ncbi:MAG: hypothetical protein MUF78_06040 [Candidatus Edwardsbacteria bacterium]|jgi:hypothetical protein|nr:hypothetical protein [Candidatus Edwardsbacteria bacterium]